MVEGQLFTQRGGEAGEDGTFPFYFSPVSSFLHLEITVIKDSKNL